MSSMLEQSMSDTVHFNEALDRRYAAGRQNDCSVKMIARKRAFKPFQTNAADGKAADRSQALPQAAASLAELIRLAEVRGMVRALGQRGDPVFEFDASGAVVCSHGLESLENGPLRIVSQGCAQSRGGRSICLTRQFFWPRVCRLQPVLLH